MKLFLFIRCLLHRSFLLIIFTELIRHFQDLILRRTRYELRKAQERSDQHEADKKARMKKVPLPANERDW